MTPESLKCFGPLVKGTDRVRVVPITHPPPVPPHVDEPHLPQHPQVLRDRRLLHPQRVHNLPHRPLLQRQIVQNLPSPRLGHRIKRIRRCCRSCHPPTIHAHMDICQAIFPPSFSMNPPLLRHTERSKGSAVCSELHGTPSTTLRSTKFR